MSKRLSKLTINRIALSPDKAAQLIVYGIYVVLMLVHWWGQSLGVTLTPPLLP